MIHPLRLCLGLQGPIYRHLSSFSLLDFGKQSPHRHLNLIFATYCTSQLLLAGDIHIVAAVQVPSARVRSAAPLGYGALTRAWWRWSQRQPIEQCVLDSRLPVVNPYVYLSVLKIAID